MNTYPAGTHSTIVRGEGFREHAWTAEEAEQSAHDTYVNETPTGYIHE